MSLAEAVRLLEAGWPDEIPSERVAVYAATLNAYPEAQVLRAVQELLLTEKFRPSVAEVVERVSENALGLPHVNDAWTIFADDRQRLREQPLPLRDAAEFVGGRAALRFSESPEILRAQFTRAYERARGEAIQAYALGIAYRPLSLPPAGTGVAVTVIDADGVRPGVLTSDDRGDVIHVEDPDEPSPVVRRMIARRAGLPLDPPTEDEKREAIRIIGLGPGSLGDPSDDLVLVEAEMIFAEASE